VSISWTQLVGVIITFVLIGGFSWFFKKSTVGISMRAVSDDQFASMSIGISVPKVFGLAWATAGLSAAAAGGIIGNITGLNFDTLHAFGIIVFSGGHPGRAGFHFGAVVAGIIMGLIQQFASGYLDGNWGLNGTGRGAALCHFAGHSAVQTPRAFRHPRNRTGVDMSTNRWLATGNFLPPTRRSSGSF
jgi:branched-chain amino acid transport system permease protein